MSTKKLETPSQNKSEGANLAGKFRGLPIRLGSCFARELMSIVNPDF